MHVPFSIGRMAYDKFAQYNVLGALVWTFLFTGAGFFFGEWRPRLWLSLSLSLTHTHTHTHTHTKCIFLTGYLRAP